jgi:TRAP-type C4-dicarboxylate transport system permease small subunit
MLSRLTAFLTGFSAKAHDTGTLIILPIIALLVTTNVMLRYLFNSPLAWEEEMNGLFLFLVLFLSITYTWDQKKHIRMEILYVQFKGPLRALADIVTGLAGIIYFGFLGIQCIKEIPYMILTNETGQELPIPIWPFRAVMAAISLVFVVKLVIYILRGRKEDEKEEVKIERDGIVIRKEEP